MIEQIRKRRRAGLSFRELGREFGISHETARKHAGDIEVKRPEKELHECEVCGNEFWAYKSERRRACSYKCAGILRGCPVAVLNSEGQVMRAFNSITEASEETGISKISIGLASDEKDKRYKKAGGYKWIRL
jgi:hypothetical protein